MTYRIEPVAFKSFGTTSSMVSKPGFAAGFVCCADARRLVDGGGVTLKVTEAH